MTAADLTVLALVVFAVNLVSNWLGRHDLSLPLVFTAAGLLLGPDLLDIVTVPVETATIEFLAEATLVLVLFSDASRIDLGMLRREVGLPSRLLLIAFPMTVALGAMVGVLLWPDLDIWELALLAAMLAPTDAALGQAVVTSPVVPVRIRSTLNVESGLNDGLAVPFVTLFVALVAAEESIGTRRDWVRFAAEQIGYGALVGVVVGVIGGLLVELASARSTAEGGSRRMATLALAVVAAAGATTIGGNPFIAAFVAGAVLRRVAPVSCGRLYDFLEREGELLTQITFFIFGAALAATALESLTARAVFYALASLTLIRMIPVVISLLGSGLRFDSMLFIAWFGPRGLATIVFVLTVVDETHFGPDDELIAAAVLTVLLSIVAHGLSASPLSTLYGRRLEVAARAREAGARTMVELEEIDEPPVRRMSGFRSFDRQTPN